MLTMNSNTIVDTHILKYPKIKVRPIKCSTARKATAIDLNQGRKCALHLKIKLKISVGANQTGGADNEQNRAIPGIIQGAHKLLGAADIVAIQLRGL
jgi:hypothetical protein